MRAPSRRGTAAWAPTPSGSRRPPRGAPQLAAAAIFAVVLLASHPRPLDAQDLPEATGLIHGFIGGITVIDEHTEYSSPVGRPAISLYVSSFRPRKFGPEISVQGITDGISVDFAMNLGLGVSYQFNRNLAVGAGGSILIGLHRWTIDDLDPHYGGYVSLTWYPLPMGSWVALGGQLRESILYDPVSNRAVYYPCIGIGVIFVPENALRLRRRTR